MRKNQQGFMLLLSTLIVTSAVIILGVAISSGKISYKKDVLNAELGQRNFASTEACLEEAIFRLFEANGGYTGGALTLNNQYCTISIQNNMYPYLITARGSNDNYTRRLEAVVDIVGGQWTVLELREVGQQTPNI